MAFEILDGQDPILLELDVTDLLRPGELFALRWNCFDPAAPRLVIQETVYKGKIRPWGNTRKSPAPVHLPPLLVADLQAWKAKCPDSSPNAFIFASENGGFLDSGNFRKRVLKRLAEILDLPNLTFQRIRRTIATLSQTKGHVKATQGLLCHARTPTTTDVYQQVIPEGVEKMVDSIHDQLRKPRAAVAQTANIAAKLRAKKQSSLLQRKAKLAPNRKRATPKWIV